MPAHPHRKPSGRSDTFDASIELAQARVAARAWSQTVSDMWRIDQASAFASAAVEAYAGEVVPKLQLTAFDHLGARLDSEARKLAEGIGREAARLPLVEALHYLTSLYPVLLPQKHRGEIGAFYTPPCLSARLLDIVSEQGLNWSTARVLDPAAGGGAFLVQAALRMRKALQHGEPTFVLAQISTRLLGLELDRHAARLAQASLEIALADLTIGSGRPLPSIVRVCDTLEETPTGSFDLVVGNPPYGRLTLTAEQRVRFARSLYGHANLYGVFTDIAVRWTKPNGLIAYLTPTSMLGGQYFAALRALLAEEAPPIALDFIHARKGVFEDVLQETVLALYRRGAKRQRLHVHYLKVRSEVSADVVPNGTVGLPTDPKAPWLAPRDPMHGPLIAYVETMPTRLSDWGYEVSTGPLVWNRFRDQLRKQPGRDVYPLIWAEAITADGRFIYRAEKRNHAPYFKLERGDGWLLVEEGCVLLQRTTAKEQHRRLIAAEMSEAFVVKHGGVVVENHLNMVRAKEPPKVSARAVAVILNSRVADQVFRCISGSVAVSAFELESLPLPTVEQMRPLERMLEKAVKADEIDAVIADLYGQGSV